MYYIEDIKLKEINNGYEVDEIIFRESICSSCDELYDKGYIERYDYGILGNTLIPIRFSEYLKEDKVINHILRLREFYDIKYYETIYNVKNKVFKFTPNINETLVRLFPMEEYRNNFKKDKLKLRIISVKNDSNIKLEDSNDVLNNIPCKVKYNVIIPSEDKEKYCNAIEIN